MREDGPGYSVHKRATVHTPKRVFVRFHFTPNYLAHIGAHGNAVERGKQVERAEERVEETRRRNARLRCKNTQNVAASRLDHRITFARYSV